MNEELSNFWNSEFDNFAPEAYNLKHEYKNRWVRFHSLPELKRYPENEDEYLQVLNRHNTILRKLCGKETHVLVVLPEYSEYRLPTKPEPELFSLFSASEPWRTLEQSEVDDDYKSYWHLHVSKVNFTGSEFNNLFRKVANEEVGNIMIVCPSKGFVFHPYDGGADVVLASTQERDELKKQHSEWLSSNPEGF